MGEWPLPFPHFPPRSTPGEPLGLDTSALFTVERSSSAIWQNPLFLQTMARLVFDDRTSVCMGIHQLRIFAVGRNRMAPALLCTDPVSWGFRDVLLTWLPTGLTQSVNVQPSCGVARPFWQSALSSIQRRRSGPFSFTLAPKDQIDHSKHLSPSSTRPNLLMYTPTS